MKETKKIESANVVVNNAKVAAPEPKQGKKTEEAKPKETEQTKTAQQLQAELEEQQREIDRRTAELQKKLKELEEKQVLNKNRTRFMETLDNLNKCEEELLVNNEFETNACRVKFYCGNYGERETFTISNRALILDFISFMRERINNKVRDIELQLLK